MKIINNVSNVVKFRTLKPGNVFMIKDDLEEEVFIRTSAECRYEHNAVNLSNGELRDFNPVDDVIPLPDAYMCIR